MQKLKTLFAIGAANLLTAPAFAAWTAPSAAADAQADMLAGWAWAEGIMWTVGISVLVGFFVFRKTKKAANSI